MKINKISLLSLSTVFIQSISLVSSLVIGNLFSPSEFGNFSTIMAAVNFILIFLSLRFETALLSANNSIERYKVFVLSILITCLISVMLSLILLVFKLIFHNDFAFFNFSAGIWLFIVVSSFLGSLSLLNLNYYVSRGDTLKYSLHRIFLACTGMLILFFFHEGGIVTLLCSVTAPLLILIIYYSFRFNIIFFLKFLKFKSLTLVFKKYYRFPLFSVPEGLMNYAGSIFIPLLLAKNFGAMYFGYYSMSWKFLTLPVIIGSEIIGTFLTPHFRDNLGSQSMYIPSKIDMILKGIIIFFPLIVFIYLNIEKIVEISFGSKWIELGKVILYGVPFSLIQSIVAPFTVLIGMKDLQKYGFFWNLSLLLARLFVVYLCLRLNLSFYISLIIFYMTGFFFYLVLGIFLLNDYIKHIDFKIKFYIRIFLISIFTCFTLILESRVFGNVLFSISILFIFFLMTDFRKYFIEVEKNS
jgi:O-antigen/teichoic acid export membrane protein